MTTTGAHPAGRGDPTRRAATGRQRSRFPGPAGIPPTDGRGARSSALPGLRADELNAAVLDAHRALGEGISVVDVRTHRCVYVNETAARMFGYTVEEFLALPNYWAMIAPEEIARLQTEHERRVRLGEPGPARYEVTVVRKDGTRFDLETAVRPLGSDPNLVLCVMRDVTGHRTDRERLVEAEVRYRQLVERLPAVTYVADAGAAGEWRYVSPQIRDLLGYEPDEWLADPGLWLRSIHPDDRERVVAEELRAQATGRPVSMEYRLLRRDGRPRWVRDEAVFRSEGGEGTMDGLITDISERKAFERELRYLADHDAVTGLVNRRRFLEETALEVKLARRGRSAALVVLDLDDFKYVNDSLGHQAGDLLIRRVAELLAARLREVDTLARLGGDEFGILLRGTDAEAARGVVNDLLATIRSRARPVDAGPLRVTGSAGIVGITRASRGPEGLLAAADIAMYEAKREGRDRAAVYSQAFQARLAEEIAWTDRLRQALDRDGFILHWQPIQDLASGEVTHRELLIRLPGGDGTFVHPGAFLPIAERFALIQEIDRWVTARAVRLILARTESNSPVRLTVNLSGRSIGDEALLERLEADLRWSAIDPSWLVFEVTETAAIANMEEARSFSRRLAQLGCQLALDDFGSGFGAFTYLKHLPVDYLKIDGEFVGNLVGSVVDQAVVRAIVHLAQSVGGRTIAEFVPDAETLALLRRLGVDLAQGYHIGPPEPIS